MRALLIGNYGVGNLGDEALREYFLHAFPDVQWTVVTASGRGEREVLRLPLGLRSFLRPWWRTLRAMAQSDGVIFGGGSLFTDHESVFACILWWWHALWAHIFHRPIILAFQGIGPFRTRLGMTLTRWVLRRTSYISVRDLESKERATQLLGNYMNKKIIQTFDPVFCLLKKEIHMSDTKSMIIIPRYNSTREFLEAVDATLADHSHSIAILCLDEQDWPLAQQIQLKAGHATLRRISTLSQLQQAIECASFVLTQRYHGAIAALAMGIPFKAIPQAPGDKLDQISKAGRDECGRLCREGEESLGTFFGNTAGQLGRHGFKG